MEEVLLESEARTAMGTRASRRMRRDGRVPVTLAVRGEKPVHLQVSEKDMRRVLRTGQRILKLDYPGGAEKVFLREIQYDHLGEAIYHVDFAKVAADEAVQLEVELVLKGKPVGVAEENGVLDQYVKAVQISCLPDSIPENVEVNVEHLKLGENLTIAGVAAPPGVKLLHDAEVVVATVAERKEEEIAPAEVEPGPAEPEVIAKEKAEEEAPEEKKEKK
ncbi:MAG: 50S ribosomal protein L25 [Planctomycetota bacterium]|jgi:large subunit ribosomal protein L25